MPQALHSELSKLLPIVCTCIHQILTHGGLSALPALVTCQACPELTLEVSMT